MAMDLFSLQSILLFLLASLYLYFFFLTTASLKRAAANGGVGFKNYPFLGTLPEFFMNRGRFLDWTTEVLASTPSSTAVFIRPGSNNGIITANPSNVEHILKTRFDNYPKGDRFISLLRDFLGEGIFNSDDELWRIQRKTASYEFNSKSLRNFVMENVTVEIRTRLVLILERAHKSGRVLDLQDILERFAFDNVCKLAFNYDPGCLSGEGDGSSEFMLAFEEAAKLSSERFMYLLPSMYKLKKLLDVGSERRLRKAIVTVHQFADDIIRLRLEEMRDNKASDQDILSRFFSTEKASAVFLRDIVISFILAGRDTTSSALTWFFWLLSRNRCVEDRILEELGGIRSRNGKLVGDPYTFDELREMHYLHAAISEAMRLYPPVAVDTKACLRDDVLPDGTAIKGGWFISYQTFAMGRMESVWGKDCREFRPERWLESDGAFGVVCRQESPFKFPVFHAGPRMCLGKDMAYIQMKSIAASVLERFTIDVQDSDTCREPLLSLTLRMKGGLPVKVNPRPVHQSL
ncbi:cytochrome P450 94A1-like [Punica granatum]|uniref:Cytochrome P450 94A1-like n=2 Tax=Punica granatum TaxID=22663 RepID=A0A6P8DBJ6_PUNGR|nr:cytochrome P450 94A1-like [Punica granatum]